MAARAARRAGAVRTNLAPVDQCLYKMSLIIARAPGSARGALKRTSEDSLASYVVRARRHLSVVPLRYRMLTMCDGRGAVAACPLGSPPARSAPRSVTTAAGVYLEQGVHALKCGHCAHCERRRTFVFRCTPPRRKHFHPCDGARAWSAALLTRSAASHISRTHQRPCYVWAALAAPTAHITLIATSCDA